jgi:hypothetical protein
MSEHDVSKKIGSLFGSCVNLFVANLCLALGVRFDYVHCTIGLLVEADESFRDQESRYAAIDTATTTKR